MKIYDCFTYFDESNLLKIRFNELDKLVEKFIIIEASQTFTGKPKPFHFDEVDYLFKKWNHKIIRLKFDFPSQQMTSWEREYFQRNKIKEVINFVTQNPNDIVIISDADEIVNKKTLSKIKLNSLPLQLDVKQYFWNFNWQVPSHCNQGARPVVCRVSDLNLFSPQELRAMSLPRVADGGWHFSFFGMKQAAKNKIEAFAHTEYDSEEYKDLKKILYRIENGIDPFDRFPLKYTEIDESYPALVKLEGSLLYP